MYSVTKSFKFCYAHRLFGEKGKCWNLHGHTASVDITISTGELDSNGMVVNFEAIERELGSWIAKELDHKTILFRDDPLAKVLEKSGEKCLLIGVNPTAENLAKLIFDAAKEKGFCVSKVRFFESDTSIAEYSP